jgi:hypothetical protein
MLSPSHEPVPGLGYRSKLPGWVATKDGGTFVDVEISG